MKLTAIRYFLIIFTGLILFTACQTTKYVPDDQYLLNRISIKTDNKQINKDELASYIRQDENLKILGFIKFQLWLYDLSRKDKKNSWLKKIGEPPVIYDGYLKDKSVSEIQQYLSNKGYYLAKVSDRVDLKKKKANVTYVIETGDPYLIRNITEDIHDSIISQYVNNSSDESLLKPGDILDVDVLEQERARITRLLNSNGYYRFMEEYIHYKIDSSLTSNQADVDMIIDNPRLVSDPSIETTHQPYWIKDYSVYVFNTKKGSSTVEQTNFSDSIVSKCFTYYFNGKIPLKTKTIKKTIELLPGDKYDKEKEEWTYNNLYSIRQFKFVNIQYQDALNTSDTLRKYLSGRIFLPLQLKQNYSFDIEGTNTSGNLGIAGNLNYQHRNLFGGGEIFDLSFKGATERQLTIINGDITKFTMNEFGTIARLSFPGFLMPGGGKSFILYSMPFTTFSAAYNYQERPDYTRTIVNATLGYRWKTSSKITQSLNIIDLNAVHIFRIDPTFLYSIKDLYIKSSYTDHIISSTNYSFVYNNQNIKKSPDYHYFSMNLETAGNTLWAISSVFGLNKGTDSTSSRAYYKLFDTRFAQYLKGDFEYRYGFRIDKNNSFASRAFFGIAFPYGNFGVIPFEKRYFTGGANGVRAWQVRSLGPGSYVAEENEYPNQSADIKIEGNLEYRFRLFWLLEGALFLDAGNIWAINQNDNRAGAVFSFSKFFDEFAVGTGLGLRLVTDYFIVRTDLGLKLRDPAQEHGLRWIPGNRAFKISDLNFNVAIGYPF